MGAAANPRRAVFFLMILTLGMSLGLPAVDVLDAVYDESEALPFEAIPQFSIVLLPVATRTTHAPLSSLRLKLSAPSPFPSARVRDTDANRHADARISFALLRTLLC
jgi:hypothetical protein